MMSRSLVLGIGLWGMMGVVAGCGEEVSPAAPEPFSPPVVPDFPDVDVPEEDVALDGVDGATSPSADAGETSDVTPSADAIPPVTDVVLGEDAAPSDDIKPAEDTKPTEDTASDSGGPVPIGCGQLEASACVASDSCTALIGHDAPTFCGDEVSYDEPIFVGCVPAGLVCAIEEVCANVQGYDAPLVFPDGCLPPGAEKLIWKFCCTEAVPPPEACEGLSQSSCESAEACEPVTGVTKITWCDDDPESEALMYLGCRDASDVCSGEPICVEGVTGKKAVDLLGCAIDGWTELGPAETCCTAITPPVGPLLCAEGGLATMAEELCVRGEVVDGEEVLAVGSNLYVELRPTGCWSSSCTTIHKAECSVIAQSFGYSVKGSFCLEDSGESDCTDDCGGGGLASCSAALAEAGEILVKSGPMEVTVTVPSTLPSGGICATSPLALP